MNINWILDCESSQEVHKTCIDIEYRLRPKLTRFLMQHLERELKGDFSAFYFDIDYGKKEIRISDKTPAQYIQKIADAFTREMNTEAVRKFLLG